MGNVVVIAIGVMLVGLWKIFDRIVKKQDSKELDRVSEDSNAAYKDFDDYRDYYNSMYGKEGRKL